jgi:mevalonate pyrophosphate decarboxylase
MPNKQQIVVKKTTNTCYENQNRIATQLLLNATKDQQVEKKIQRRIRQLKTNYRRRTFDLSFATFAFDLSLSNLSSSFNFSSSSSSSSSFNFSSFFDSFSFNLFAFVLLTKDLSTRDLSIN